MLLLLQFLLLAVLYVAVRATSLCATMRERKRALGVKACAEWDD